MSEGLLVVGVAGFALAVACIYLFVTLITITLDLELLEYLAVNVPVGALLIYSSSRFIHTGLESLLLLASIRRGRDLRGLKICAR